MSQVHPKKSPVPTNWASTQTSFALPRYLRGPNMLETPTRPLRHPVLPPIQSTATRSSSSRAQSSAAYADRIRALTPLCRPAIPHAPAAAPRVKKYPRYRHVRQTAPATPPFLSGHSPWHRDAPGSPAAVLPYPFPGCAPAPHSQFRRDISTTPMPPAQSPAKSLPKPIDTVWLRVSLRCQRADCATPTETCQTPVAPLLRPLPPGKTKNKIAPSPLWLPLSCSNPLSRTPDAATAK